jgi:hypothetical protein
VLAFITLLIMLGVTYAYWHEGLLTTCTMCINVVIAGLVAFFFFEPIADQLDGSFVSGYEDCLCLVFLFSLTLGLLRLTTNSIAYTDLDYPPLLLRGGVVVFGLLMGYLVAGFLLCAIQTLPLPEEFMGLEVRISETQPKSLRRILPPDRVWLAMMHRAGAGPLSWREDNQGRSRTFDPYCNFPLRYARYRRSDVNDSRRKDLSGLPAKLSNVPN